MKHELDDSYVSQKMSFKEYIVTVLRLVGGGIFGIIGCLLGSAFEALWFMLGLVVLILIWRWIF